MVKRGIPQPKSTLESQSIQRFQINARSASAREFRDAITKVTGGVRGVVTESAQWGRISP